MFRNICFFLYMSYGKKNQASYAPPSPPPLFFFFFFLKKSEVCFFWLRDLHIFFYTRRIAKEKNSGYMFKKNCDVPQKKQKKFSPLILSPAVKRWGPPRRQRGVATRPKSVVLVLIPLYVAWHVTGPIHLVAVCRLDTHFFVH